MEYLLFHDGVEIGRTKDHATATFAADAVCRTLRRVIGADVDTKRSVCIEIEVEPLNGWTPDAADIYAIEMWRKELGTRAHAVKFAVRKSKGSLSAVTQWLEDNFSEPYDRALLSHLRGASRLPR